MKNADPGAVSARAVERGKNQLGTLGSGNHYLEIQVARENHIYDKDLAEVFGITVPDQILIMVHTGSRGFGHQIASDYLKQFLSVMNVRYGITMPDRELACAPFYSDDGQNYFNAMNCAINYAFLNRQLITHRIREVFHDVLSDLNPRIDLVYDVCHNTAKLEKHVIENTTREILVHRKGATRAFAPGMDDLPPEYRDSGQPVIIGGSMETASYLLAGVKTSGEAFFSTAHGSGRNLSRRAAKKKFNGRDILDSMESSGIHVRTSSLSGLAEEAGGAYKDIDDVVMATERSGLSRTVAKLIPLGNIKG